MAVGPGSIGFAAFTGVKFLGYSVAAVVLKKSYDSLANSRSGLRGGLC